jgi:hypothetical protein
MVIHKWVVLHFNPVAPFHAAYKGEIEHSPPSHAAPANNHLLIIGSGAVSY